MARKSETQFPVTEHATVERHEGIITLEDLREKFGIPPQAEVFIQIPEGNWSNIRLSINKAVPIQVAWETTMRRTTKR
jgi:hypothetical protein